ncbi:Uncharacterised protein [Mycobacteroides abscessus subsp. abscessus]|nr:Uncharacterised protein [Mycobacteroides abscessus subsp. abscessus]
MASNSSIPSIAASRCTHPGAAASPSKDRAPSRFSESSDQYLSTSSAPAKRHCIPTMAISASPVSVVGASISTVT